MTYNCSITPKILSLSSAISHDLGRFKQIGIEASQPILRRTSLAKSLQATAAIEGNTLTLKQVDSILDGRPFLAKNQREVLEVQNAASSYREARKFNPFSVKHFLKAHQIMMQGLVFDAGKFRHGQVGIWQDGKVRHMAPPAKRVPILVDELFLKLRKDKELPGLVKAAIFHFEIEFIHPFSDGNGRMGRLWQHVMLLSVSPVFEYCPFESVIYERQSDYYTALRKADVMADAAPFVEFALDALLAALTGVLENLKPKRLDTGDRLKQAQNKFAKAQFSRRDYLLLFPSLSTATASRDLASGVMLGWIKKSGDKSQTVYEFRKIHSSTK